MTYEALPPNDPYAESSVIASMLVDPDAAAKVAPIVRGGDGGREPLNTKRCWRCGVMSMKSATRCQDCGAKL